MVSNIPPLISGYDDDFSTNEQACGPWIWMCTKFYRRNIDRQILNLFYLLSYPYHFWSNFQLWKDWSTEALRQEETESIGNQGTTWSNTPRRYLVLLVLLRHFDHLVLLAYKCVEFLSVGNSEDFCLSVWPQLGLWDDVLFGNDVPCLFLRVLWMFQTVRMML